jgi:hypothetical protein
MPLRNEAVFNDDVVERIPPNPDGRAIELKSLLAAGLGITQLDLDDHGQPVANVDDSAGAQFPPQLLR